ncbi:hypothetical protein RJ55_02896 [Drechmeria coniospora]|nr:hypothetical protein RJ55_02896 [Drechmeria coniospora]
MQAMRQKANRPPPPPLAGRQTLAASQSQAAAIRTARQAWQAHRQANAVAPRERGEMARRRMVLLPQAVLARLRSASGQWRGGRHQAQGRTAATGARASRRALAHSALGSWDASRAGTVQDALGTRHGAASATHLAQGHEHEHEMHLRWARAQRGIRPGHLCSPVRYVLVLHADGGRPEYTGWRDKAALISDAGASRTNEVARRTAAYFSCSSWGFVLEALAVVDGPGSEQQVLGRSTHLQLQCVNSAATAPQCTAPVGSYAYTGTLYNTYMHKYSAHATCLNFLGAGCIVHGAPANGVSGPVRPPQAHGRARQPPMHPYMHVLYLQQPAACIVSSTRRRKMHPTQRERITPCLILPRSHEILQRPGRWTRLCTFKQCVVLRHSYKYMKVCMYEYEYECSYGDYDLQLYMHKNGPEDAARASGSSPTPIPPDDDTMALSKRNARCVAPLPLPSSERPLPIDDDERGCASARWWRRTRGGLCSAGMRCQVWCTVDVQYGVQWWHLLRQVLAVHVLPWSLVQVMPRTSINTAGRGGQGGGQGWAAAAMNEQWMQASNYLTASNITILHTLYYSQLSMEEYESRQGKMDTACQSVLALLADAPKPSPTRTDSHVLSISYPPDRLRCVVVRRPPNLGRSRCFLLMAKRGSDSTAGDRNRVGRHMTARRVPWTCHGRYVYCKHIFDWHGYGVPATYRRRYLLACIRWEMLEWVRAWGEQLLPPRQDPCQRSSPMPMKCKSGAHACTCTVCGASMLRMYMYSTRRMELMVVPMVHVDLQHPLLGIRRQGTEYGALISTGYYGTGSNSPYSSPYERALATTYYLVILGKYSHMQEHPIQYVAVQYVAVQYVAVQYVAVQSVHLSTHLYTKALVAMMQVRTHQCTSTPMYKHTHVASPLHAFGGVLVRVQSTEHSSPPCESASAIDPATTVITRSAAHKTQQYALESHPKTLSDPAADGGSTVGPIHSAFPHMNASTECMHRRSAPSHLQQKYGAPVLFRTLVHDKRLPVHLRHDAMRVLAPRFAPARCIHDGTCTRAWNATVSAPYREHSIPYSTECQPRRPGAFACAQSRPGGMHAARMPTQMPRPCTRARRLLRKHAHEPTAKENRTTASIMPSDACAVVRETVGDDVTHLLSRACRLIERANRGGRIGSASPQPALPPNRFDSTSVCLLGTEYLPRPEQRPMPKAGEAA